MGLLDFLGIGGGAQGKVARLQKKVLEKFGPPENRQGAIEELGELRTEAAIEALLPRYTIRVDPGITDDEEKARVLELVVEAGKEVALPPLRRFVETRDEISWPLRALSQLLPEAELTELLVAAARREAEGYSRVPEKKKLLLQALGQRRSPAIAPAVLPFLEDMDDDVQIAAAEVLAHQGVPETRQPLIEQFLRAADSGNARVREALAAILAGSGLDVKGYTPRVEAALPEAYRLDAKGHVVHR